MSPLLTMVVFSQPSVGTGGAKPPDGTSPAKTDADKTQVSAITTIKRFIDFLLRKLVECGCKNSYIERNRTQSQNFLQVWRDPSNMRCRSRTNIDTHGKGLISNEDNLAFARHVAPTPKRTRTRELPSSFGAQGSGRLWCRKTGHAALLE